MPELVDLVIVGAGPAGLAAAAEATHLGVPATLVDACPYPGGQYYRRTPPELHSGPPTAQEAAAQRLLERVGRPEVSLLADTVVWGIFSGEDLTSWPPLLQGEENLTPWPPLLQGEGGRGDGYLLCLYGPPGVPRRLRARQVILTPGAHDRPVPFPGWTLPGVMTAGAALHLVKHQRLLPGHRILLSGTGPLQWILAQHLLRAGAQVVAILEAAPLPWHGWRQLSALWGQWQRLGEGLAAWRTIRRAGTPVRWGYLIHRAEGNDCVEQAVIGPAAGKGNELVAADTICLGYGFTPDTRLAQQAGCLHRYDPGQQAYLPVRDDWLQTTQPGLYVAGDGAGIGGKDVAEWEGRLAALAACRQLGREVPEERIALVRRELARQRRAAAALLALFPIPPHLGNLVTDDTVICRCEEITAGDIRRVVAEGAVTLNAVRMVTRAGMGRCQGRMCGGPTADLLGRITGRPVTALGQITPRPPIVPVPLEGLLEEAP